MAFELVVATVNLTVILVRTGRFLSAFSGLFLGGEQGVVAGLAEVHVGTGEALEARSHNRLRFTLVAFNVFVQDIFVAIVFE